MTPAMTRLCCPTCRLRFILAAAYLDACPECGEPLRASSLRATVGFRLFGLEDVPPSLPEAVAVSIPVPGPERTRP
jgi:hypothetical protein